MRLDEDYESNLADNAGRALERHSGRYRAGTWMANSIRTLIWPERNAYSRKPRICRGSYAKSLPFGSFEALNAP